MNSGNAMKIIATIDAFLDTCPGIPEEDRVLIGPPQRSAANDRTLVCEVVIGAEHYLVSVERITEVPR